MRKIIFAILILCLTVFPCLAQNIYNGNISIGDSVNMDVYLARAAANTGFEYRFFIDKSFSYMKNNTIGSNVTVVFTADGYLTMTGYTMTVSGAIEAPYVQITDGTITYSSANDEYYNPVWVGSTGNLQYSQGIQVDHFYPGTTAPTSTMLYGGFKIKVWNPQSGGADITANDLVELYDTAIEICADTAQAKPFRVTNSLDGTTGFGVGYGWVKWTHGGTSDADTVIVWGKDPGGTSIIDTLILTGGASPAYGDLLFADIDSATAAKSSAAATNELDIISYCGVKASAGSNAKFFGVAASAIADSGGTGFILATPGTFAKVTVDANSTAATPGIYLIGAASGDAVTYTPAAGDTTVGGTTININAGKIIGRCIQPSTLANTAIWVYLTKF